MVVDSPDVDVVVVGGGLAGLSAVIEADEALSRQNRTPRILLLECGKNLGGNSAKATSGINGFTSYEVQQGIVAKFLQMAWAYYIAFIKATSTTSSPRYRSNTGTAKPSPASPSTPKPPAPVPAWRKQLGDILLIFLASAFASLLFRAITSPSSLSVPSPLAHSMVVDSDSPDMDVVVVGGGLAGLSAVIEAHEALSRQGRNPRIVLLEREKNVGGNSAKATSGINGLTSYQVQQGIVDSAEAFTNDTLVSGGGKSRTGLVKVLVDESGDAVAWVEKHANITLSAISMCGGHGVPRTHREPSGDKPRPIGFDTIRGLSKHVETLPGVEIRTNARVTSLLFDGRRVSGVAYTNVTHDTPEGETADVALLSQSHSSSLPTSHITSTSVILATGGYASDWSASSLLKKHGGPRVVEGMPTTSGDWARGDGVKFVEKVGGEVVDLECVQVHPTAFIDPSNPTARTKFLAAEALRAYGAILLTPTGTRFANELGLRDYLSDAIFSAAHTHGHVHGQAVAWMVMTERGASMYDTAAVGFYAKRGLFKHVTGVDELAAHMGVAAEVLRQEFEEYIAVAEGRKQDPFGKTHFATTFRPDEPLYVAQITPAIHYTMGGALIDADARVLKPTGEPVQGLFAAGEVTGGVHGGNRLAGNSLLECVVFGRRAGRGAAGGA
ncbi:Flavocytochrome c [Gonapodya prolifera JEL478]|uniref:fumarate reductase (NADH) n=1 Tax=Gonapodya prolifera (strain JEL478) TaxID=1344416 RepID=A0A138ZYY7_GONPJ|nr:Flavocytochrome c [Gonapodya prolifera JEL478]|eukprot:KXS09710.1 Flavocytochrome c [Gonapodya prolifera JEL478]